MTIKTQQQRNAYRFAFLRRKLLEALVLTVASILAHAWSIRLYAPEPVPTWCAWMTYAVYACNGLIYLNLLLGFIGVGLRRQKGASEG